MVTHSLTGQTASQTPQPQQACMLASYRPSGVTSKHESGHCSQHRVHLMQVSKFTTGRMVRVVYFLNVGLRSGRYPPVAWLVGSSTALPAGMLGMAMPSPISCHLGRSNLYGVSGLPWLGCTVTEENRSWARAAESAFTGSCHSSAMAAWTDLRLN